MLNIGELGSYFQVYSLSYWNCNGFNSCLNFGCLLILLQRKPDDFHNSRDNYFYFELTYNKVYKNGPNKFCGSQPLKNWKGMVCFDRLLSLQIFIRQTFVWSIDWPMSS